MLVLHTVNVNDMTALMSSLYDKKKDNVLKNVSPYKVRNALVNCLPEDDIILIVGYGSEYGLEVPENPLSDKPGRVIFGEPEAGILKQIQDARKENNKKPIKVIGIWPGADKFARKHHLQGLFCGDLITTVKEAEHYGTITLQMHIDEWNETLFTELRELLSKRIALSSFRNRLSEMNKGQYNPVTNRNIQNLKYYSYKE